MPGAGGPSLALLGRQIVRIVGLAGQFVEEAAGKRGPGLAPLAPAERQGERQPALGPRDAHVTQAPFFVHRRCPASATMLRWCGNMPSSMPTM